MNIFNNTHTRKFHIIIPTNEGMTPWVLDIGLSATAQEQDGHSKPKKPKTN
jgi:hypothetical protein